MEQGSGWNERSRGENKRHKGACVYSPQCKKRGGIRLYPEALWIDGSYPHIMMTRTETFDCVRYIVTIVFMSVVDTDEFGDGVLKLAASTDFYGAGYFWIWTHLQEISARTPA
ncbi:unnamed protein product [Fusarium graminearum]|nr:unnamed protein product [Fusarium graminearum]